MNRLKELRNEYNLTIRALADILNIGYASIGFYELETRDFNTAVLKKFSEFFSVSIDYLLCHCDNGIFVMYENDDKVYSLNEVSFKKYLDKGFIYYKDYKRYLDINAILGVNKYSNISELLEFISISNMIDSSSDNNAMVRIPFDKLLLVEKIIGLDDDKLNVIKGMIDFL